MHPILARSGRIAAYVAIWLPLGVLLAALLAVQGVLGWTNAVVLAVPMALAYGFLCLSAWYLTRGLPFDRTGAGRVVATAVAAAVVSSAAWLVTARGWIALLRTFGQWSAGPSAFRASAPTVFGFGVLLYLLALAISYLVTAAEASQEAERRSLGLQVLAREAELRALRAQIDPHFLFNSLQSISALTSADPAAARRMCVLLADFLRETLALGARDRIPLSSELALARRFLAVEQLRFGDRLHVEITAGGAEACEVPPLLLQPLVENAVTHGIAHALDGGMVRIHAERRASSVTITIENPCDPDRPVGRGTGLGLRNVRERLRSFYGNDAALMTDEIGGRFMARVEMPLP
jgi:two-component system sensor histidine kinase AlgZ